MSVPANGSAPKPPNAPATVGGRRRKSGKRAARRTHRKKGGERNRNRNRTYGGERNKNRNKNGGKRRTKKNRGTKRRRNN